MQILSKQEAILYLNYLLTCDKYFVLGTEKIYSSIQEWQDSGNTSRMIDFLISKFKIQSSDLDWNPTPMPEWCYLCGGLHQRD